MIDTMGLMFLGWMLAWIAGGFAVYFIVTIITEKIVFKNQKSIWSIIKNC